MKKTYDIDGFAKGGPYSHVVEAGGFLYLSGMLPVDPDSGVMIKEDIPAATEMILKNIQFALEKVGSRMADVVKATVFLTDMGNFEQMNNVYKTFFPENPPARSCVAVKGLPMGSPIEIEAIASR